ncbi:hypothetical protein ABLB84_03670 [Xenorhabdus szentirmaii]|uniref:hypothetical protein n=1 Tax=Xenorhabdus szentirmaii TaxID=290112 RepID=UPI0032B760F9
MKNIVHYIVNNSVAILTLSGAFFSGVGIIIHRIYKGITLFSNRRISKNRHYLNEYVDFIKPENKEHIEKIIESEVMLKVTKIRSPKLRRIVSKLERDDIRPDCIRDIKKLNLYVNFDSESPVIKIDFHYKLQRFSELMIGGICFTTMTLIFLMFSYSKNGNPQGYDFFMTLLFMIATGMFSGYFATLSPSKKRIKQLNEILSAYRLND